MTEAKMSGDKMTNGMTKRFRFNSRGKLTDEINLTDDYKTSLRKKILVTTYKPHTLIVNLCTVHGVDGEAR